ncbi:membrane protein [Bacillus manliponensis]|uniref:Membrane protein n=1 Tax=Bacillus manliponensis TaxID=574376 RepID=A0A073JZE3_9BACI|nr:YndM family protein [Bacillus manliponensis]KEK19630.1 membrane protein [Bacillus manliponensis]
MNNILIFLTKFVAALIAFAVGLDLFFDATITQVFSFSLFVTVVSYMLVDRVVLPRTGMRTALMVDFLLTYSSVWIFGNILLNNYMQIAWGSILSAMIFTLAEVFVHRYVLTQLFMRHTNARKQILFKQKLAYGTEFAEEQHIKKDEKDEK